MTIEELQEQMEQMKADYEAQIKALNGEAAKYRKTASARAEELKKFEGLDLSEIDKLKADAAQREEDKLKEAGKFDELKANLTREYEAKLEAAQKFGNGWQQKYESVVIDKALIDAGAKHNGIAPAEIAQLTRSRVKLGEDGNPFIMNANGDTLLDEQGNRMTIDGYVGSWLQDHPHHVKASGGGAGSSNNGDGSSGTKKVISSSEIGNNLEDVASGKVIVQ